MASRSVPVRLVTLLFSGAAAVAACSDDDPSGGPTTIGADAGMTDAGGSPADAADPVIDAAPRSIRCTSEELAATDLSDGGVLQITFNKGASPEPYVHRCATVRAGASVRFTGSFRQHPLQPAGGDLPNPITHTTTDQPADTLVVTMPTPGTFGFECEFHPLLMFGAIRVVP